jgi:broad specificity phosphatase PhoE
MRVHLTFETHSWSEDNDRGTATGWLPGRLSERGRGLAAELGGRRAGAAVVFVSDLRRAMETAEIAFAGSGTPVLADWRLRECDYGRLNGMPAAQLHANRRAYLDQPYPEGESWRGAVARVGAFLDDLQGPLGKRWSSRPVLIIGHVATRWALDCRLAGRRLEDLIDEDFAWREGWGYELSHH